jgi:hypothetical protein
MSSNFYLEAIADAKKLREIAEQNAKNAIVESITPKIRDLIDAQIMSQIDDDFSPEESIFEDVLSEEVQTESDEEVELSPEAVMELKSLLENSDDSFLSEKVPAESEDDLSKSAEQINEISEYITALNELMENIRGNAPEDMPAADLKNHVALVAIASKSTEKIQEMLENSTRVDMLEGVVENSNDQIQQIQEEINQMKRSLRDLLSEEVITIQLDLGDEVEVDPGDVEVEVVGADEEEGDEEVEDLAPDEDEVEAEVEADDEEAEDQELDLSELVNELEEMDHGANEGAHVDEEEVEEDYVMEGLDDDTVLEIDEDMLREELAKLMQESEDSEEEVIEEASEEEEVLEETAEPVATEQNDELQAEIESYQSAVTDLQSQLAEMSLFNAKLLYTNKLLMNSDLSQTQRAQAIETLDDAASLREVKLLFKTLTESFTKRAEDKTTSRNIGGASRPTKSASMNLNESKETNRWALLAGINK